MSTAPTPSDVATRRPARARSALRALVASEARLLLREPGFIAWAVVIPVVATVVLAVLPATRRPEAGLGGWSFSQLYLPVLVLFTASLLAVQGLPTVLAQYRADGVLKRLRTTSPPPSSRSRRRWATRHPATARPSPSSRSSPWLPSSRSARC